MLLGMRTRQFCETNVLEITLNDNICCSNFVIGTKVADTNFKKKTEFT